MNSTTVGSALYDKRSLEIRSRVDKEDLKRSRVVDRAPSVTRRSADTFARYSSLILLVLWALFLLQLLTLTSVPPFSPLSLVTSPNLIAGAFVVTSVSLVHSRARWLLPVHLAIVLLVVASHLLTTYFGRDGSLLIVVAYFLTVLIVRTSIRPQYRLLVASSAIGVLILESLLSLIMKSPEERFAGLPDYDVLVGAYHEGGFLVPNFDAMVVGETGGVPWVTNRLGFRDRNEVDHAKPPALRGSCLSVTASLAVSGPATMT